MESTKCRVHRVHTAIRPAQISLVSAWIVPRASMQQFPDRQHVTFVLEGTFVRLQTVNQFVAQPGTFLHQVCLSDCVFSVITTCHSSISMCAIMKLLASFHRTPNKLIPLC